MPTHCLISFGSNLGDRDAVVARAARLIDRSGIVAPAENRSTSPVGGGLRTSRLFETPPIGGPGGQSPFLNAVAAFATSCSAAEVLDVLQQTEQELGRKRHNRWGARSIDLDVVLHGRLCGDAPAGRRGLIGGRGPVGASNALVVPHPRYTARKFVVLPACDVAADFCDPRFGWTLADLAAHLDAAPPSMALTGGDEKLRHLICDRLHHEHSIQIMDANDTSLAPVAEDGTFDPAQPWVSPNVPPWVSPNVSQTLGENKVVVADDRVSDDAARQALSLPRLIARIERTTEDTRWPAPHRIWASGWRWPEYRLEVDDLDWAIGEMASALDSMRCEVRPVTSDGNWW